MKSFELFLLSATLALAAAQDVLNPRITKQYGSDYVYNRDTNAFYKLHIETRPGIVINDVCNAEGSELMKLSTHEDFVQIYSMFKKFPDLGEYVWVADDGQEHESVEEQRLIDNGNEVENSEDWSGVNKHCLVVTWKGEVKTASCYRRFPFICKMKAIDAPYDLLCGGKDYKYFASVGSCYKISRIMYTWSDAYSACQAEGAHLVVLNSETEREVVQNLISTETRVEDAWFLAGFRANEPTGTATDSTRVFKTVQNQTLEEAGFSRWSENEPNNRDGREYCGSIYRNDGTLNDMDCIRRYYFICEKEVQWN